MKTLGRILIISFVFILFAGLMVVGVNAIGMNAPGFGGDGVDRPEFRPTAGEAEGNLPLRSDGERGERNEGSGGIRLMFGMIKNIVVIAVLVVAIVWPKNIAKKRKRLSQQA